MLEIYLLLFCLVIFWPVFFKTVPFLITNANKLKLQTTLPIIILLVMLGLFSFQYFNHFPFELERKRVLDDAVIFNNFFSPILLTISVILVFITLRHTKQELRETRTYLQKQDSIAEYSVIKEQLHTLVKIFNFKVNNQKQSILLDYRIQYQKPIITRDELDHIVDDHMDETWKVQLEGKYSESEDETFRYSTHHFLREDYDLIDSKQSPLDVFKIISGVNARIFYRSLLHSSGKLISEHIRERLKLHLLEFISEDSSRKKYVFGDCYHVSKQILNKLERLDKNFLPLGIEIIIAELNQTEVELLTSLASGQILSSQYRIDDKVLSICNQINSENQLINNH